MTAPRPWRRADALGAHPVRPALRVVAPDAVSDEAHAHTSPLSTPRLATSARLVMRGLTHRPRTLPSWFVRAAATPELLDASTCLREQAIVAHEHELFTSHAADIASDLPVGLTLVELGADRGQRLAPLFDALLARQPGLSVVAVNASDARLVAATLGFERRDPRVELLPRQADFVQSMAFLAAVPSPRVVVIPAGRLGAFSPGEAATLLWTLRAMSSPLDMLMLVVDQRDPSEESDTSRAELDDAGGVGARLGLGALDRLSAELGADFDRRAWRIEVVSNAESSRDEVYLVARIRQPVFVDRLGLPLLFEAGERIHIESRQRHPRVVMDQLLDAGGYTRVATYESAGGEVALVVARAR